MSCSIALTAVNGIVQSGQTDPSRLRVTGVAYQCASVTVSSAIANASSTVPVDGNGRFRAELTITATPAPRCGDLIQVRVECVGQPTCFVQEQQRPLTCCEIPILFFQAVTPLGSLLPSQLSVQGTIHGCATDQVVISSSVTATTGPISVDPYTGAFSALLPITSAVKCDDKVTVTAACSSGAGCTRRVELPLNCPNCYRGTVTVDATAACTGTPPKKPITLNVTIGLPAGAKADFHWDYGDGSPNGANFTIDNTAGNAGSTYPHSEAHDYAPGTYTATMKIDPPREACPDLTVTVVVQCTTVNCPTITVDPPQFSVQCANGKRTVTLSSHITAPAGQSVFAQWDYGDGTVGAGIVVNGASTVNNTQTHDYAPGTYTASLTILSPSGCPPVPPVQVVVPPCTTPPCTLVVQGITVQVGACNPATGSRTVTATGSVNNNDPADLYYWQWDTTPAQVGLPAAQGTTQQHDYSAPGSAQSTYNITLTVIRSATCVSSFTRTVTIDGCGGGCPSRVTDPSQEWTVTGNVTAPLAPDHYQTVDCDQSTVTMSVKVDTAGLPPSGLTYTWDFGDGSTVSGPTPGSGGATQTHTFVNPTPGQTATYTITVTVNTPGCSPLNIPLTLTVPGCARPPCPRGQHRDANSICVPDGNGGGGLPSCAVLLWAAIIFMLIGGLVTIVGCILAHFFPQAGLIVGIIGIAIFAIGAILFLIWWIVCRLLTACAVILAVRAFVMVMIAVFAVIAIIIAIFAIFTPAFWPCAAAASVYGFAWGGVLAMLDWLAQDRKCIILNPSGGSSAASSSSGLTGSDGSTRLRVSDFSQMSVQAPVGLGDVISRTISAMGIQPCVKCQERAKRLNVKFPFGTTPKPGISGHSGAGV